LFGILVEDVVTEFKPLILILLKVVLY